MDEKKVRCHISGKEVPVNKAVKGSAIREHIKEMIREKHPTWTPDDYISITELNKFRVDYIQQLLKSEKGELSELDKKVIESIGKNELLSQNLDISYREKLTTGQKLADGIARFGGSWTFIIIFMSCLFAWMIVNTWLVVAKPFDPFPFIFLNLILSCIAAIQAPVIMMSQNRQSEKDRFNAEHDYMINLKSELEIRTLHEKLDHMRTRQWERLLEIQEMQLELLEELTERKKA